MKQKLINGLLVIIILFFAVSVVGILILDGVAQSIIQKKGSEGLGTKVTFSSVHVGFFSNDSGFKDLTIANPEGFYSEATPAMLTVKEASIEFSILSLLEKSVEIKQATATGVVLSLQEVDSKTNLEEVIHHISKDETPKAEHPEPTFNIEIMTIKDITVIASGALTVIDNKPVTAHIPELVLHQVGTDGDSEVATEVLTAAVTKAIMEHISDHPVEGFSKIAFSNVTNTINSLPIFHQLGVGSAVQNITDTIGKGVDSILNIFDNNHK